eukprot:TRINITY_DN8311_c0_g1_i1.p1 TRINITY_DN8311_c0_g1~~TRINITY_DN8311_c0_g1_i1.p1  ORF type:complete len:263 (+),score=43.71 TRINITY_DN8311_c0_g1_i1:51-791(+)
MVMQQQPAQVNMQPTQGTAQPKQEPVQMGLPVVVQPVIVVAGGGGVPVPQPSDEQLAHMAKGKRFRLVDGQWKFNEQPTGCAICFIIGSLVILTLIPYVLCIVMASPILLVGLIAPIIMLIVVVFMWKKIELIFDDSQKVVLLRSKRASCMVKETVIRYSDCISFNAVLRAHHSSTSSHYVYSLTTLGGNYEVFGAHDTLEEASLNAFLRERLAAAGIEPQMPANFQQPFVAPQPLPESECAPAEL